MNTQIKDVHQLGCINSKRTLTKNQLIQKEHQHEYTNSRMTPTWIHKSKNDTNMNTQLKNMHQHEYTTPKMTPTWINTNTQKMNLKLSPGGRHGPLGSKRSSYKFTMGFLWVKLREQPSCYACGRPLLILVVDYTGMLK